MTTSVEMDDPLIFEQDDPSKSAEYLRMSLSCLNKKGIAPTPLNYSLAYTFYAGKSEPLNEKLESIVNDQECEWDLEKIRTYFMRYLIQNNDVIDKEVHDELLVIVAHTLGILTDIAGKAALSTEKLQSHVDELANGVTKTEILTSASKILENSRHFVKDTSNFEAEVNDYTDKVKTLESELKHAKHEALTDALTGINNRRAFEQEMIQLLDEPYQTKQNFCMILADLDHFKHVNDTYGHLIGDRVLCAFSNVLSQQTRAADFPARYGGEEFAILLPDTSLEQATAAAEHIRKTVENLRLKNTRTGDYMDKMTVSLGVASYRHGETAEQLIQRCDEAVYKAKKNGRNCVSVAN